MFLRYIFLLRVFILPFVIIFQQIRWIHLDSFLFVFLDDPGALRWCCDQLWQNPDITPKVEPSPKLKENMIKWKDKQCYVAVGKEAKPRCDGKMAWLYYENFNNGVILLTLNIWIFNDINCFIDLTWCCRIVHLHSDFIPGEFWGSFQDQSNRKKWNKLYCEVLVGGKKKEQCKGSIQSVRIWNNPVSLFTMKCCSYTNDVEM